jgi:hypothetical protein
MDETEPRPKPLPRTASLALPEKKRGSQLRPTSANKAANSVGDLRRLQIYAIVRGPNLVARNYEPCAADDPVLGQPARSKAGPHEPPISPRRQSEAVTDHFQVEGKPAWAWSAKPRRCASSRGEAARCSSQRRRPVASGGLDCSLRSARNASFAVSGSFNWPVTGTTLRRFRPRRTTELSRRTGCRD